MANEAAVIVELLGDAGNPIRFVSATNIPRGTLCKIVSPRTAQATAADNDQFAGIAAAESQTTDSSIALYTCGLFSIKSAAAFNAGEYVSMGGANTVSKVAAADKVWADVGVALETTAGADELAVIAVGVY